MLRLTNHAIYQYAKRVFYQDVSDKRRDLTPKMYNLVKNHALEAIKSLKYVGKGSYPLAGTPLIAVVENHTVKTFVYKPGQIEKKFV